MNAQEEAAKRAARRAVLYLGDAADSLAAADRLSGNREFMRMANEVSKVLCWVRDITEEME